MADRRTRVYVAGPISKGDLKENVRRGVSAGLRLLKAGYAPLIPHLSCYVDPEALIGTLAYEWWLDSSLSFIEACDGLLRLDGESKGADREEAHARLHGVPVFWDLGTLLGSLPARREP